MSPVYAPPPAPPPAICAGSAFVDIVGTSGPDRLEAFSRATRVWGLGGADILIGSATRASCLLGGTGNDVLFLNSGGGVAHGNQGRDIVIGSDLGDVIDPGQDADSVRAGGGDDKITTRDGHAEIVNCGPGADIVKADRTDLLVDCESTNLAGPPALRLAATPRRANNGDALSFRVPVRRAGRFTVRYVNNCHGGGAVTVADLGRLRRARTVSVPSPAEGWCRGTVRLAVIRDPGQGLPPEPVARAAVPILR